MWKSGGNLANGQPEGLEVISRREGKPFVLCNDSFTKPVSPVFMSQLDEGEQPV